MRTGRETVILDPRPPCDICQAEGVAEPMPAQYDGKMITGPWAFMCESHMNELGVGLGVGRGQRLITAPLGPTPRKG